MNTTSKPIPTQVRNFAILHKINLGYIHDSSGGYYFIRDPETLKEVEFTRTARPKVCHALAMCRRYIASRKVAEARAVGHRVLCIDL